MKKQKLKDGMKPCPFCTRQPKAYQYSDRIWTIGCECGCETLNSVSKKGAKRIWNRRRYTESVAIKLPSDIEMDEKIIAILVDNLSVLDDDEEIICNKFATSLKIIKYIKSITKLDKPPADCDKCDERAVHFDKEGNGFCKGCEEQK